MPETGELSGIRNKDIKLKNLCVVQRGKKFYYPKSIPQERGPLITYICVVVSALMFFVDYAINVNEKLSVVALYSLSILLSMALQLFYRIILALEECKHLQSRYNGNYINLLKNTFHFPIKFCITLFILILYALYYFMSSHSLTEYKFGFKNLILLVSSVYFIGILLEMDTSPLNDSLWIAKNNGLDYGSGMAYSFFYGYLYLILPKTGTQEKNLKELMQDYEDQNGIQFSIYKLFILIPKSLICTVSLKNENSPSIQESSSLPPKFITVAGVQDRVYKNAVYKIVSEKTKSKIYVSAEFATPLKTFMDVFNKTGEHSEYYEKHKADIILQFYLTLKKVLETTGLNQFCELIYYEDFYLDEDNQIHYYDVGKIILTRLRELKKQKDKSD